MTNSKAGHQQTPSGPFFVSATQVYEQVKGSNSWTKVKATTLAGAKRAAVRLAVGATFSARVATRNAEGKFDTLVQLHSSTAITGRRAGWTAVAGA